jgi:glycosyltransferase involved in cell wall biosynthesis
MKVGYVVKRYPLLSQTFIVNEIIAHESAGLDLEIFSLRPPTDEDRNACRGLVRAPVTYVTAEPHGTEADQALVIARLAAERGITHLHAHFGNVATTVARLASRRARLPYTFTAHARDIFHESVVPSVLAQKLEEARAVVTVSDFNATHLRASYRLRASHVHRIYNGLDLRRFAYAPPVERPRTIVSVGRLVEKKGFRVLLEACARLSTRGVDFRCIIAGGGPLEGALRADVARLGLDRVVELAGPLPHEHVAALVQRAAVFAAPCVVGADGDRDGLPTVLLEAMALGTPCVATDVTGIPEIVRHGCTGLIVGQHDAPALADATACLLDDSALRARLASAARRLMEREFDIHANAARLRALFAEQRAA